MASPPGLLTQYIQSWYPCTQREDSSPKNPLIPLSVSDISHSLLLSGNEVVVSMLNSLCSIISPISVNLPVTLHLYLVLSWSLLCKNFIYILIFHFDCCTSFCDPQNIFAIFQSAQITDDSFFTYSRKQVYIIQFLSTSIVTDAKIINCHVLGCQLISSKVNNPQQHLIYNSCGALWKCFSFSEASGTGHCWSQYEALDGPMS